MNTTLAEGLTPARVELASGAVVTVQETAMTPAVTISAAFRAGSVCDPPDYPGLSYLTGRVLDRGTSRHSARAIAEALDDRGVSLKVSTGRHTLTLSCTCLADDFDDVLAIVGDVSRRAVFLEEEIEKQRREAVTVLGQQEDNPASRALDSVLELLYTPRHPYGRPTKGTVGGLTAARRPDLVAFHAEHVVPASLSLVVVGKVAPEHAVARAATELDGWSAGPPPAMHVPPPPTAPLRQHRLVGMPGKPQADIVYGFTTVPRLDPRFYAYWLMNHVLGQFGLGGRLADNIRERQGMAYYAFSTLDALPGDAPLLIRAGVDPADVDRALAAIDHEVAALAREGPTVAEIEECRSYIVGAIPRMLETNENIAAFLQTAEEFGLGLDFDRRLPGLINEVTPEAIHAAAAAVLNPERAAITVAGPLERQ